MQRIDNNCNWERWKLEIKYIWMQRRQVWWGYFHWPKVIFSHTLNFVPFSIFCSPIFFQGRGMLGHPHFWIIFVALFAYLIMHIHRQRACCFQRALIFIWLLFSVLLDVCRWQSASLLSLIHIWRCRRIERCRSRWSPYH